MCLDAFRHCLFLLGIHLKTATFSKRVLFRLIVQPHPDLHHTVVYDSNSMNGKALSFILSFDSYILYVFFVTNVLPKSLCGKLHMVKLCNVKEYIHVLISRNSEIITTIIVCH